MLLFKCKVKGCLREFFHKADCEKHEQQRHCLRCGESDETKLEVYRLNKLCNDCQMFHDAEMEFGIHLEV